jgi:hypothetical protein
MRRAFVAKVGKAVAIELNQTVLPALRMCPGDELCDDEISSGWQLTVASTRQLTCVRRYIDTKLTAYAPEVLGGSVSGFPNGPGLPPFDESIHATLEFGLGLTWEEVAEAAKHPSIQRIYASGLALDEPPDGCPPDFDAPIIAPICSSETVSNTGKFSSEAAAIWQASTEPNEVIIAVRREHHLCPLPDCPGRTGCPERDRYLAWQDEMARASQACVRALIASIGGTASDEVFAVGNALPAFLSWGQIQTVAAHPDVLSMESNIGLPPP